MRLGSLAHEEFKKENSKLMEGRRIVCQSNSKPAAGSLQLFLLRLLRSHKSKISHWTVGRAVSRLSSRLILLAKRAPSLPSAFADIDRLHDSRARAAVYPSTDIPSMHPYYSLAYGTP